MLVKKHLPVLPLLQYLRSLCRLTAALQSAYKDLMNSNTFLDTPMFAIFWTHASYFQLINVRTSI